MGDEFGLNIHQVCWLSATNTGLQKTKQNFPSSH